MIYYNPNDYTITREYIEKSNIQEPECIETDREQAWFDFGLNLGLEIADKSPKSPWISVNDDLPCNHTELTHGVRTVDVLVIDKDTEEVSIDHMKFFKLNGEWDFFNTTPQYWMPIPNIPHEE